MVDVSIIVPFKNGERYLEKCLKNLQKQIYQNYEIILIDDNSTDNSKNIINNFLLDSRIKYYYIAEESVGVGKARNLGIQKAEGKYIMFVDVDDFIDEQLLMNLQPYIDRKIELIKYKINDTVGPIFGKMNGQDGFNILCFKDKFLDSPCVYLIRRDFINRIQARFMENVYHEDFGLIPLLIVNAKSIVSTPYQSYFYIQSENSIMRNNDYAKTLKKVNDKLLQYDRMIQNLNKFKLNKITEENLKIYYTNSIILGIKELKRTDRKKFGSILRKKEMYKNIKIRNFKQFIKRYLVWAI